MSSALSRDPFGMSSQIIHHLCFWNALLSRNGTQHKSTPVKITDKAAVERNNRLRLIYDRRQHVIQIESRGDLLGDFQQRSEYMDFALRFEQLGVVQGHRSLFTDAREEK